MTERMDNFLARLNGIDANESVTVVADDPPELETLRAFARMGSEVVFIPVTEQKLADKLAVEKLDTHVLMIVGETGWVIPDGHPLIEQTYDLYAELFGVEEQDHGKTGT